MDDLLLKVFNFLVIPESSLSIVFLVLFAVCFLYGILKVVDCRRSLQDFHDNGLANYQQEMYRLNQRQFMNKFISALSAKEVKITDMPNIFVSIGILGTFLGLGVAIHGAADLLNADRVDLMQLNSVLSVIAFKFQTSVWGTCFSLIFQKFILEPYFVYRQKQLGEVETAIYADAVNQSTAMQWQLAELQGMHAALTSESDTMRNSERNIADALHHQSKSLSEMAEKMNQSRLEDNARQLKEFRAVADNMLTQQMAFTDTLNAQNLVNNNKITTELLNKIDELVGDERRNNLLSIKELLSKIGTLVGDSNDSNMKIAAELLEKVNSMVDDVNESNLSTIQELLKKISDLISQSSSSNARLGQDLLTHVTQLVDDTSKNNNLSLRDLLRNVTQLVGDTNISNAQISREVLDKVGELISEQGTTNDVMIKDLLGKVSVLVNDSNTSNAAMTKDLLEKVDTLVSDSNTSNAAMTKDLLEKVNTLVSDSNMSNAVMTKELVEKVDTLVSDSSMANAALTKELVEKVDTLVSDSSMANAALTKELVEKVDTLVSDSNMANVKMTQELLDDVRNLVGAAQESSVESGQAVMENVAQQLVQQKGEIQEMLALQNATNERLKIQQEVLLENAEVNNRENMERNAENIKEVLGKVTTLIDESKSSNAEMTKELLSNVKAFVGDAQDYATENGRSIMANVADQLMQQKNEIQEMLARQNEINEKLKVQQEVLLENAEINSKENIEKNTENIRQVLEKVGTLIDESKSAHIETTKELLDNVKALVGDAQDYANKNGKSILGGVAEQLTKQRKHMEEMISKQSQLNEALLGDVAETEAANAKNMREGIVQQMEEYKQYARQLAEEQKQTQEALENRLQVLTNDIDKNSDTSNENITELRRAIDVLQKAIDTNSNILEGIVDNFVNKQRDMDELRRSEIKAMAESFGTLFNQESQNMATWRKMKEDISRSRKKKNSEQ